MVQGDATLLAGTYGGAQSRKGLRVVLKKSFNGSRCGTQPDGFTCPRQAREGLWITSNADFAKPSGWLSAFCVGNPDSIAASAGAPTLRMAGLTHHPTTPFAALRAFQRVNRTTKTSYDQFQKSAVLESVSG